MHSSLLMFSALAAGVAAPMPRPAEGIPTGTWTQVSSEQDPALGPMPKDVVWKFADGKATWQAGGGKGKAGGTFKITADPRKDPREIDMVQEVGGRKVILHGIYKMDGSHLVICLGLALGDAPVNEGERPKAFKPGPGVQLLTLERREK